MDIDCKQDMRFKIQTHSKLPLSVLANTRIVQHKIQIVYDYTLLNKVEAKVVLDYSKYCQHLELHVRRILRHCKLGGPGVLFDVDVIPLWDGQMSNGASRATQDGEVYEILPVEF